MLFQYFLLQFLYVNIIVNAKTENVNVAVLVPYQSVDHGCTKAAIQMAIDDVNKESFITKTVQNVTTSYILKPAYAVVGNEDAMALDALYNLYSKQIVVATIGPPYATQNEFAHEFTTEHATQLMSYSEFNEPLELVFGAPTPPSILSSFHAASELLKLYDWSKVAIVYDYSDKRYAASSENFRQVLRQTLLDQNKTVEILADQGIWSEPAEYRAVQEFDIIEETRARIMFGLVGVYGARKMFCEAYQRKMFSPKVVWILFENLPNDWATDKYNSLWNIRYRRNDREISCTETELLRASQGYIAFTKQGLRHDDVITRSGMTAQSFRDRLHKEVNATCHGNVGYAYDAVWTLAFGHQGFVATHPAVPYVNFKIIRYYWYFLTHTVQSFIHQKYFEGLTGPIIFRKQLHDSVHRVGQISVWSNTGKNDRKYIGMHDTETNTFKFQPNPEKQLFQEGIVPSDTATYKTVYEEYEKPLYITMWVISLLGILLSSVCLITIIVYSCDQNVNFTSPRIYSITVIGSYLCFVSVILYGIDTKFVDKENIPKVCWSYLITISIGFTLTFGSLFSKAWQIYREYLMLANVPNEKTMKKQELEWKSLLFIAVFIIIDIIIFSTWYHFSPFTYQLKNTTEYENIYTDTIELQQIIKCSCEYETEFTIGIFCYKGAILLFGLFLAYQAKNATAKHVGNDAKSIIFAIYNVVAISIIGVISTSVLKNTTKIQALYSIVAVCVIMCTITTLLLVFIPKITLVLKSDSFMTARSSDTSSANDVTLHEAYRRSSTEKDSHDMKPGFSTGTLTTEVSEQNNDSTLASSVENTHSQSVISMSPNQLDNSSYAPSYLTNSTVIPSYLSNSPTPLYDNNSLERSVDAKGRLSSGVYVGTIKEEED